MGKRSTSEAASPALAPSPVWVVSYPGRSPYRQMWDLQRRLWTQRHAGRIPDTLLLLEHEPVVTLGKNARSAHLLLSEEGFRRRGVEVIATDRGGDVTYHGPGQLVAYWIFDLKALYQDVHRYLRAIEEVVIRLLRGYGIDAGRSAGATGVWVGPEKIAAMGMHLSHWVSTHGFALNVTTDLRPFSWIVPCGLAGRGVTSMERLLGHDPTRARVEEDVVRQLAEVFHRRPLPLQPVELADILMMLEREDREAGPEGSAGTRQREGTANATHQ
jgi:lipoyl(octanoyl) transferase